MGKGSSRKSRRDKQQKFYGQQALKSGSRKKAYVDPRRKEAEEEPEGRSLEGQWERRYF